MPPMRVLPPQPKLSGPQLVGRVVALEGALVALAKLALAPLPPDRRDAAIASLTEAVHAAAAHLGHEEAAAHAETRGEDLATTIAAALQPAAPSAPPGRP